MYIIIVILLMLTTAVEEEADVLDVSVGLKLWAYVEGIGNLRSDIAL
jgi:hypothetical protein